MMPRPPSAMVVAAAAVVVLAVQGAVPRSAAAAPAPAAPPAADAAAGTGMDADAGRTDRPVGDLLDRLRVRYRQADRAAERYDTTQRRLTAQRAKVKKLDGRLEKASSRVHSGREDAGQLARSQYRGVVPGMPPLLQLLLSGDPVAALAHGHALTHAVSDQTAAVKRLTGAERRRDALADKARKALHRQQQLTHRRKVRREELRQRLHGVEELLIERSPGRRAVLGPAAPPVGVGAEGQDGATDPR